MGNIFNGLCCLREHIALTKLRNYEVYKTNNHRGNRLKYKEWERKVYILKRINQQKQT